MQVAMEADTASARKAKPRAKANVASNKQAKTDIPNNTAKQGGMPKGGVKRRPSVYANGILMQICDGLSQGLSIKHICEPDTMPHFTEVYREMKKNQDVATAIAQAREAQQDFIADEIIEMADTATPETVNVVKLQIWARQWRAAKLAPKKYGEKQSVEVTADIGVTAARVLMDLTQQARDAKAVIDVTPTLIGENTVKDNKEIE